MIDPTITLTHEQTFGRSDSRLEERLGVLLTLAWKAMAEYFVANYGFRHMLQTGI